MWDVGYGMRDVGCGMRDAGYGTSHAKLALMGLYRPAAHASHLARPARKGYW